MSSLDENTPINQSGLIYPNPAMIGNFRKQTYTDIKISKIKKFIDIKPLDMFLNCFKKNDKK